MDVRQQVTNLGLKQSNQLVSLWPLTRISVHSHTHTSLGPDNLAETLEPIPSMAQNSTHCSDVFDLALSLFARVLLSAFFLRASHIVYARSPVPIRDLDALPMFPAFLWTFTVISGFHMSYWPQVAHSICSIHFVFRHDSRGRTL